MTTLSPVMRLAVIAISWVVWSMALLSLRKHRLQKPVVVDTRARRGLILEIAAYVIVYAHEPDVWNGQLEWWRAIAGATIALFSTAIFWSAVASLGRQWRFDAGLNRDHELVQTGTYRIVRHPIYASMLGMLLASIFWIGSFPAWPIALALFIAGTEIRIAVEDNLLRERFGDRFTQWRRSVPAYFPFVR